MSKQEVLDGTNCLLCFDTWTAKKTKNIVAGGHRQASSILNGPHRKRKKVGGQSKVMA
jgi:hypothetical protein